MGNIQDLLGGSIKRKKVSEIPHKDQFLDAMSNYGMDEPSDIIGDGKFHRFNNSGKRDKSGWYVFHEKMNGPSHGSFGDWREGTVIPFVANMGRELTMIESMNYKKQAEDDKIRLEAERKKVNEAKGEACEKIWESSSPASNDHPYLAKKGISGHGAKVIGDGRLALPLYNPEGSLKALQYISGNGVKRFENSVGGCFNMIGPPDSKVVCLVEGFADAATIVEETGFACYIAYSGGNMPKIAPVIKSMGSHQTIIVVSDHDESGKGQEYAQKAASLIGAKCIVPPNKGDVNDMRLRGEDVKSLFSFMDERQEEVKSWLSNGMDFCLQPSPIKWLVKGWIQEQALCMIHGESGGGKTFTVLDMALRVASGSTDWHGAKVKPGKVVYLAGEGHHGLRARLAGWVQQNDVKSLDFWVSSGATDLDKADGLTYAYESIESLKVKPNLIIVDTLHRFMSGDENTATDTKVMLDSCANLMRHYGCSVLLVHHTGVSKEAKERARGSSAWRGALDIEINVIKGSDKTPMEVKQVKSKDAEQSPSKFFKLKGVPIDGWLDEDGEQVTTAILEPSEVPKESKAPAKVKLKKNLKRLEEAWSDGPREWQDDMPVISRKDLLNHLIMSEGLSKSSAEQELRPSSGRMMETLLKENCLKRENEGELIIVTEPALVSIFRISRN